MKKKYLFLIIALLIISLFSGCSGENNSNTNNTTQNTTSNITTGIEYKELEAKQGDITEDIKSKINGSYLKSAMVEGNKITIRYEYSKNKQQDVEYFETGDKINKVLMEDPFRVIRNYSNINQIHEEIANESQTYYEDITKEQLENFLGFKMNTIKNNDEWVSKVSNPIFTKQNRQSFINQYIKVKK
jgi:uncharacterized protein YcfL